jgi:dipeptidyl aminopeptidase/acylaminoacyl peptidase
MEPAAFVEALLSLPTLWGPQVSRDGRWVAWTWFQTGPAADVYVAPADGSSGPIRLTETPQDTVLVSWTPDGNAVIVSQDRDGNQRAQLFRVDLDNPGTMHPLTEPEPSYFLHGGQLHPNGRWLIYAANVDADSGEEIEPSIVYRHDLGTGERRALARPSVACYYVPELNRQGTHILYNRNDLHPAGQQVWLVDIDGREDREIINVGPDKKAFASWLPDGRNAIVVAETDTHQRLGVWNPNAAGIRWLIDDPAHNVESASVPPTTQEPGQVMAIEYEEARLVASVVDTASGAVHRIRAVAGSLLPLAPVDPDHWVGTWYSSRQPEELVRFSPSDLAFGVWSPESLSRVWDRTPIRAPDLTAAEDFRWSADDGLGIQGWLYRTAGEVKGTVIYVHGGPSDHMEDMVSAEIQFLAGSGYHVLAPNYRGSTGFGLGFREAIKEDGWGGREQDDIRAGIEALIAAGVAEPGRVGITGTSYGGYSSWWAITHFPRELVAAAAPICGMTDLVVDYETTQPELKPYSEEMMGGSPQQVPERYRERSPLYSVGKLRGRLLIIQGLQDPNVTPENVRVVREALEADRIPYEILTFDDEGHGVSRPRNLKTLYLRLARFFEEAFA